MARTLTRHVAIQDVIIDRIVRFREVHDAGEAPNVEIEILVPGYVELDAFLGKDALLTYGFDRALPHYFAGIVTSAAIVGSPDSLGRNNRTYQYVLRIDSRLGLLDQSFGSEIFQEMTVKEIVTAVLQAHGIESGQINWKLSATYVKRQYCLRYQESALNFVKRLIEDEGIYFFVESDEHGRETFYFADTSAGAEHVSGEETIVYRPRAGAQEDRDHIFVIADHLRTMSGKFTLRDYNFEKPDRPLEGSAHAGAHTDLERFEYPGLFSEAAEGDRRARVRLDAEQAQCELVYIEARCGNMQQGRKLKIAQSGFFDGEYFIVNNITEWHEGTGAFEAPDLVVRATLLPASTTYRLPKRTPWPAIVGPQTARVVAPAGSSAEEIHTDEYGRCKVKFHWDLSQAQDEKAFGWVRVGQPQTSGSLTLARLDWEVLVDFIDGNPDHPIVNARMLNGLEPPTYALPQGATRTAWRARSSPGGQGANEIRLEDKTGAEEIMIVAQRDNLTEVENDATINVGNFATSVVHKDYSLEVGGDHTLKVTKGVRTDVTGTDTLTVEKSRTTMINAVYGITAAGNYTGTVGTQHIEINGLALYTLLQLAKEKLSDLKSASPKQAAAKIAKNMKSAVDGGVKAATAAVDSVKNMADGLKALGKGDLSKLSNVLKDVSKVPSFDSLGGSLSKPGNPFSDLATAQMKAEKKGLTIDPVAVQLAGGDTMASEENVKPPEFTVEGIEEEDKAKGKGELHEKITGKQNENTGKLRAVLAHKAIDTNVDGNMVQKVGFGIVELVKGDRIESSNDKTEKALGLVVISKEGEEEKVGDGGKMLKIGGALVDKLKGTHSIEAKNAATFIGAFHKIQAETSISLKCGSSEIKFDSSGIQFKTLLITFLAAKIQATDKVSEV